MAVDTNILRYQQRILDSSSTLGSGDLVMDNTALGPEYSLGKVCSQDDRVVLYIDAADGDWEIVQGVVWIAPVTRVVTFHREQTLLSSNNNLPVTYQTAKKLVRSKPEWDWQLAIWQLLQSINVAVGGSSSSASSSSSSSSSSNGGASSNVSVADRQYELDKEILRELRRIRKGSEYMGVTAEVSDDDAETEY